MSKSISNSSSMFLDNKLLLKLPPLIQSLMLVLPPQLPLKQQLLLMKILPLRLALLLPLVLNLLRLVNLPQSPKQQSLQMEQLLDLPSQSKSFPSKLLMSLRLLEEQRLLALLIQEWNSLSKSLMKK